MNINVAYSNIKRSWISPILLVERILKESDLYESAFHIEQQHYTPVKVKDDQRDHSSSSSSNEESMERFFMRILNIRTDPPERLSKTINSHIILSTTKARSYKYSKDHFDELCVDTSAQNNVSGIVQAEAHCKKFHIPLHLHKINEFYCFVDTIPFLGKLSIKNPIINWLGEKQRTFIGRTTVQSLSVKRDLTRKEVR